MTTEQDEARVVLLAQIALEGVRMTPEAQEIATMERLQLILRAARLWNACNSYCVQRGSGPSSTSRSGPTQWTALAR